LPRHVEPLPSPSDPDPPSEVVYTSRILPLFVEYLDTHPQGKLLDVGPVCGGNIRFFASRVAKLYVCDLFQRLCQETRQGRSASHVWRDLNYPVGSFEAVQLWDLGDYLEDRDFTRLVELCVLMVKPKGMMMLIAMGEQEDSTFSGSLAIGAAFRLHVRPQPDLDLPRHHRHNREMIAMLSPFKLVKSFIYRNGLREFLFQHP
jgi:2-polyprenyl-3-methyl-5-hydroxy-6-metoxy-1,4-benzoquinol methylase